MYHREKVNYRGVDYGTNSQDNLVNINGRNYRIVGSQVDVENLIILKEKVIERYFFDIDISISNFFVPSQNRGASKEQKNLSFSYCIFNKNVSLGNEVIGFKLINALLFKKSDFAQELLFDFNNKEISGTHTELEFIECNFGKKLKVRNDETIISNGDVQPLPEKSRYPYHQQNKAQLKELKITDCTADKGAYLRIGFLDIGKFELSNLRLPQNAELNIGDCHFQCFKLTNFRNMGKFKLYKINVLLKEYDKKESYNPRFQIDNTSIGETDFQSINLVSFARVIMFDNIFTELEYTNMQWKHEIEVGQFGFENIKEMVSQFGLEYIKERVRNYELICNIVYKASGSNTRIAKMRDTYRALKKVMIRNHDQQEALVFYQKEMENHWQITEWKKDFGNKITLAFNKYTNEFGLNWWKPLRLLFGVSLLFYFLLLCNLDIPILELEHWRSYFEFLNPTHKTRFIAKEYWDFWSYAIDFLFRLIEGLLIYQTIQAFRKYSRKL
ncbi:hypothetical protein [Bathymodiolus thermophilus thioautotrophic gill symbiont]|uniref:Uncharacterized protein n=1 Tax=Bathymodiolus thermophilus thioautotrophic gill symbiont TaxID=2360 RepID=A0A1J5UKS1_9GAMM|nr:hypothetical protein [Bathymodiolus thermophilus thioautotrophic gill symbiont]OIR24855.1 hypothetical protein BGC33_04715 [Bathymodiolus thermophilus thioautotrophic gill symbiont]